MAIVVNSDASVFKRTANLPASNSISAWGWFRVGTDRNTFTGMLSIVDSAGGSPPGYIQVGTDTDGLIFRLYQDTATNVPTDVAFFTATVGTWYFVAITCAGTGANATTAYVRAITANTFTVATITLGGALTPAAVEWGRDGFTGDYLNGQIHACGLADVVLSAEELLKISYFHEPHLGGIRGLNCIFPCIESVNTTATVDRSGNGRDATATVGALADSPALLWRPIPSAINLPATSSADVTLALTGVSATAGVGSLGIAHDQSLSGNSSTGTPGTLGVSHAQPITGTSGTGAVGSVTPSSAVALSGNAATGAVGSLGPAGDEAEALTGVSSTASVGTLGVAHSQALAGNTSTTGVGTLGVALAKALTGNASTTSVGSVTPSTTIGLAGNAAACAVGSLGAAGAGSASLSGVSATAGVGTLGVSDSKAITGNAAAGTAGDLAAALALTLLGNEANGQVGTLTPFVPANGAALTGVSATCQVGTLTPVGGGSSDSFLPDWYSFLKANAAIAALVGDRIFPLLIPLHVYARATLQPVIVFSRIGGQRAANYCETERIVIGNYQFDCYARKYVDALALGEALRFALEDYVGMVGGVRVRLTRQDNEFELLDPEPGLYRVSSDWSIWYIENV